MELIDDFMEDDWKKENYEANRGQGKRNGEEGGKESKSEVRILIANILKEDK